MNGFEILLGLLLGVVLSHIIKGYEFKISIKHLHEAPTIVEVTEEMREKANSDEKNKVFTDVMSQVNGVLDDYLYGEVNDE